MALHTCTESKRLERIETDLNEVKQSIDNKKDGLFKTMLELTSAVQTLADNQTKQTDNIDKLAKIVDTLRVSAIKTDAEDKVISKLAHEKITLRRWLIGVSIPAALAIIGLVLSIIL